MKIKILNTIWVMGVLTLAMFCLSACDHELDIQQAYPFTVKTMPVPKKIAKWQTVEIRCELKRQGHYEDTGYTIRYFQYEGKGMLRMDDGTVFKPNDRYPLTKEVFRLYFTSASAEAHNFIVVIEGTDGNSCQLVFDFNHDGEDRKDNAGKKEEG